MSTEQITKTAIITGGSSGMGLGVARAYVERGGNVVLNGLALVAQASHHRLPLSI